MAGCVDSPDEKETKAVNKPKRSLSIRKKSIQQPTEENENTANTTIPRSLSKKRTKEPITAGDSQPLADSHQLPPAVPRSLNKRRTKENINYYEGPENVNIPPKSLSKRRTKDPISNTTITSEQNQPDENDQQDSNHQQFASVQRSLSKKRTKEAISQNQTRNPVDTEHVRLGLPPRPIPKKKSVLSDKCVNVALEKLPAKESMLPRKSFGTIEENKELTEINDSIIECSVNVKSEPMDDDDEVMNNSKTKKRNSTNSEETNIFKKQKLSSDCNERSTIKENRPDSPIKW